MVIPTSCVKHHRSLVNAFMIFSICAIIAIPLASIGNILCMVSNGRQLFLGVLVTIEDVLMLALIPITAKFAFTYYDAVFLTTPHNLYIIVVYLAGGIWISAVKIAKPISGLLGSKFYSPNALDCSLNGTYGDILAVSESILTPFYSECAIIATGIMWEMWSSFVPKEACRLSTGVPPLIRPHKSSSPCLLRRIMPRWKLRWFRRHRGLESQRLIKNIQKERLEDCLVTTWILSAIQSTVYFATCLYFVRKYEASSSHTENLYIAWSIETAFILPFLVIYIHLRYISNPSLTPIQYHALQSKKNLGTHDVMLLLCSCGLFCQSMFRLSSAAGLLFTQYSNNPNDLALYVFAIFYSIVIMIMTWQMTSFLLRVQKYKIQSHLEMKWNLVCLINIIVTNAMQWLIESVTIEESPLPCTYFSEKTGRVVGILLNPFATLYGLHAALMAYETYKLLFKKALDEESEMHH